MQSQLMQFNQTQAKDQVKILLVDDHPENLLTLEAILGDLGETLVKAQSGEEALRCLLEQDFAVILLDVQMPSMDGFETASLIRKRPRSRQTPIIFVTAFNTSTDFVFRGYSLGAVDYLLKPIEPAILKSKVSVFVDLYRKTAALERQTTQLEATRRELQQANHRLNQLNAELEERVRQRTAELEATNQSLEIEIRDRNRAEVALQTSEEQLRLATTAAGLGMWFWTLPSNDLVWTPLCKALFGLPVETEITYKRFLECLHPDDRERVHEAVTLTLNTSADYDVEFRILWPDGSIHWIAAKGQGFADETGTIVQMMGVVTDISDRKQAEQERLDLLEREQNARTEAESANRIKDEFLAVLSHELRSPLNPILGWSKLLRTRTFDENVAHRALESIERNAKLQTQLIEDLLDVSRILQGKLVLNISPVSLVSTIEAAMETVRLAAEAKSIQIETQFDMNARYVSGDPNRLQQVIWNLLSNAVKFTPEGGHVTVQLSTDKSEQGANYAQIKVSDTGRGIQSNFLPYVFERFRQADGTTTRVFGGLGLGLSIVRHLVELHGGTVSAESAGEDQGATFIVRLPLMAEEPPLQQTEALQNAADTVDLKGVRVLIVDDEADTRDLLSATLQQYGAEVVTAHSALDALDSLTQSQPDILLSDISMPEMDGYTFIHQVRSLFHQKIPAIALTAYASDADAQKAIREGFHKHLAKPIEPLEVVAAVSSLVHTLNDVSENES